MATTATLAASAAAALIKKLVDDVYEYAKGAGIAAWTRSRADIKDLAVAKALFSITRVKTLWNIEKEVSLYDFYYPATIEFGDGIKKRVSGIRDFGETGNFVIQGTAGQGKSIFLRYLCGQELVEKFSSGRIPVFVELRRIRAELDIYGLIYQALERFKLPHSDTAWKALADSGKIVLLLDAFDEIDPTLVPKAINDIESISEVFRDRLQILVTSRPESDIQRSSRFRVFKLAPLMKSDHSPFLKKICSDREQSEALQKVLQASSSESPRVLRRLQLLRRWSHEQAEEVLP